MVLSRRLSSDPRRSELSVCERCGNNTLIADMDDDLACWFCGFTATVIPAYIMDVVNQRTGRESLLREPSYRGVPL